MKTLLALCTILALVSCSMTNIDVNITASGSARVTGDVSIPTTQDTSGEGAAATQGAAAAVGAVKDMIGKYIPDFSQETTVPPLQPVQPVAPPLAPVIEEEIAEPEALEDAPAGEVIEVD